mmetsp:Transcript_12314/g.40452  ORF Transcript_12314/g.40452 Transcript_12314/m.40452 type:complete len:392 (+) Transcript_12314:1048-2223(+)
MVLLCAHLRGKAFEAAPLSLGDLEDSIAAAGAASTPSFARTVVPAEALLLRYDQTAAPLSRAQLLALLPLPPPAAASALATMPTGSKDASGRPQVRLVFSGLPVTAARLAELSTAGLAPQRALIISDPSGGGAAADRLAAGVRLVNDENLEPLSPETLAAAAAAFAADVPTVRAALEGAGVAVVEVSAEDTLASPASAAGMLDPFAPVAAAGPIESVDALPASGDGSLGACGVFCPVRLVQNGALCRGKPEQAVRIAGRTFLCSGAKELSALCLNPGLAPLDEPPPLPPPFFARVGRRRLGRCAAGGYASRAPGSSPAGRRSSTAGLAAAASRSGRGGGRGAPGGGRWPIPTRTSPPACGPSGISTGGCPDPSATCRSGRRNRLATSSPVR